MSDNDQHKAKDSSVLSGLARPEYVIAIATLWLYLAARSYLDGYLGHYLIRSHYFNPSVFTLIAFSSNAIIGVLVVAAIWQMLSYAAREWKKAWLPLYLVWVCPMVYFLVRLHAALTDEYEVFRPWESWVNAAGIVVWVLAPVGDWAMARYTDKRIAVLSVAYRFLASSESKEEPNRSRRVECERIVTEFENGVRRSGPLWFWSVALWILLAWSLLNWVRQFGFIDANTEFKRLQTLAQTIEASSVESPFRKAAAPVVVDKLLFHDGTATLRTVIRDGHLVFEYTASPEGKVIEVTTAGRLGAVIRSMK